MFDALKSLFSNKPHLLHPEYQYLFDKAPTDEWVCLDFEMTGLNAKTDHILSVGAVKIVKQHGLLQMHSSDALSLICRPPVLPTPENIIIHGLRPIDVENGINHDELLAQLLPFIGSRPIIGFCVDIDMAFLNALVKPFLGKNLKNQLIDVSKMEQAQRQKKSGSENAVSAKHLDQLIDEYQIPRLPAHDALNDAIMTAMVFCHLYRD
ncbi:MULTISPECIES: 3'-5' exonuclease [unclassified Acinetobacter]|uniref:3'-5' exonuclease n=1 Tax=unclassified Acinetobacter TaxID=196816 RepID=UPI0035B8B6FB